MRLLLARIFYVVFCIGGMVGLGLAFKYAVSSMQPIFLGGFIGGSLFVAALWALVHYFDRNEGRYRSGPDGR
jgi:hypothetical protein